MATTRWSLSLLTSSLERGEVSQISYHNRHNPDLLRLVISETLNKLNQFYGSPIAPEVILRLSGLVIEEFWTLTPEDIEIFVREAMAGRYGQTYGALTPPTILQWLHAYRYKRDETIEEASYMEHISRKNGAPAVTAKEVTRFFEQASKKLNSF